MQALYQLSYAPDGEAKIPADAPALLAWPVRFDVSERADDSPAQRYTAALANEIEHKWQDRWDAEHVFWTPNRTACWPRTRGTSPTGPACSCSTCSRTRAASGLHVGHPLGYIATDVYARFQRMNGFNVLHAMGYDAFGLPAEQYAVQTGHAPARHHRSEHREHEAPAARARPRPRPAPRAGDHRRRVLPVDAVDLPADLQLLVRHRRRPRPADRRAGRTSSRSGSCPTPDDVPFDDARPRSSSARSSTRTGSRTWRKRR